LTRWLSVGAVAALFGVSVDVVRRWAREGQLRSSRTKGRHRRFRVEDVLPYAVRRKVNAAAMARARTT